MTHHFYRLDFNGFQPFPVMAGANGIVLTTKNSKWKTSDVITQ
jgi:hypothetical protein